MMSRSFKLHILEARHAFGWYSWCFSYRWNDHGRIHVDSGNYLLQAHCDSKL